MNIAAGDLDRRIRVEFATEGRDRAGDQVAESWGPPPGWPADGKRWAAKRDGRPSEQPSLTVSQQVLRQIDTVFTLRWDRFTSVIAPETHRIVYRGRAYEIVGLGEGEREDGVILLCSSRPDQRGASAPDA